MCLQLNEIPDGYAWQADVGLRGPAEIDGVPVQTDVLQRVPDVVEILQVAERVLVHGLNIVALQPETEGDNIIKQSDNKKIEACFVASFHASSFFTR